MGEKARYSGYEFCGVFVEDVGIDHMFGVT